MPVSQDDWPTGLAGWTRQPAGQGSWPISTCWPLRPSANEHAPHLKASWPISMHPFPKSPANAMSLPPTQPSNPLSFVPTACWSISILPPEPAGQSARAVPQNYQHLPRCRSHGTAFQSALPYHLNRAGSQSASSFHPTNRFQPANRRAPADQSASAAPERARGRPGEVVPKD